MFILDNRSIVTNLVNHRHVVNMWSAFPVHNQKRYVESEEDIVVPQLVQLHCGNKQLVIALDWQVSTVCSRKVALNQLKIRDLVC